MEMPKYIVFRVDVMRKGTSVELTNVTDEVEDVILKADRKTENSSEKPNNCEVKNYCDDCLYTDTCDSKEFFYACTSKATISKMEQVDEPKTQMKTQNSNLTFEKRKCIDCNFLTYMFGKTWCNIKCENPHDKVCDRFKPKDEPQTVRSNLEPFRVEPQTERSE